MSRQITDSTTRFSARVADYVAGRPGYPRGVIQVLSERFGFDSTWRVADVGAGTGISSRLFLENGNPVTIVEPNHDMRAAADEWLGGFPGFASILAPAEATTLPDGSVDLVVAAQAFHWFDHAAFARECERILTPHGRVLVMWNDRDMTDDFPSAYEAIAIRYAPDYAKVGHRKSDNQAPTAAWFEPSTYGYVEVPNPQRITLEVAKARMASSSYMPSRGHPDFEPMLRDVEQLFEQYQQGGTASMAHVTRMNFGRPREVER